MAEYMGHTISSVYTVGERTLSDAGNRITRAAGPPPNGFYTSPTSVNQLSNNQRMMSGLQSNMKYDSTLTTGLHPAPYGSDTVSLTPADWLAASYAERLTADTIRSQSELIRADATTLCLDACARTHKAQQESTKKLGDRADDIKFWRDQLRTESDLATRHTKALMEATRCLEKALEETQKPLDIAEKCLKFRQQRIGVDLINDGVHKELLEEIDNIRRVQCDMKKMLDAARYQVSLSEKSTADLESAITRKNVALTIDTTAEKLGNASRGLQTFDGVENIDNTTSIPETWTENADNLIKKSMKLRSSTKEHRERICQLLADSASSLARQWNIVNAAFTDRIRDYMDAKHKLEVHLAKVQQEMIELEKAMELIRHCIQEKEAPLKVAQTRLASRLDRPDIEACKDLAKLRLTDEISEIKVAAEQLRAKLADMELTMTQLAQVRASLEVDLSVKNNSIQVDRELCMGLRKSCDMTPRVCASCSSSL